MTNGNYTETLKQPGFFPFFSTQFLGAFNDNFLKIVVSFVALNLAGERRRQLRRVDRFSVHLALGAVFRLRRPSRRCLQQAHHLGGGKGLRDRHHGLGAGGILSPAIFSPMLAAVFLMGLHAAFFSPAKYGILPEMLPDKDLSRGNGLLEMSTFMAIILGTSLGGAIFSAVERRAAADRRADDRHRRRRLFHQPRASRAFRLPARPSCFDSIPSARLSTACAVCAPTGRCG